MIRIQPQPMDTVTNNYPQFYDAVTGKPRLGTGTAADYRERARQRGF